MPIDVSPPSLSRKTARTSTQNGGTTVRTVRRLSVSDGESPLAWSDGPRHGYPNRPRWPSDEKAHESRPSDDPDDVPGGCSGATGLSRIRSASSLLALLIASATCSPDHAARGRGGEFANCGDPVGQPIRPRHGGRPSGASDSA
jgi:hypothetical protein